MSKFNLRQNVDLKNTKQIKVNELLAKLCKYWFILKDILRILNMIIQMLRIDIYLVVLGIIIPKTIIVTGIII